MSEVELDVEIGSMKFRAKGPEAWVEARLNQLLSYGANPDPRQSKAKGPVTEPHAQSPVVSSKLVDQWKQQQGVTDDILETVFHRGDERWEVIASSLGNDKAKSKQTVNAYLLQGIASFLTSGEAKFADEPARALCQNHACYDLSNHAATLKSHGNLILGNAKEGWSLTKPGLTSAATLIKSLASPSES